jgi:hypothetical protein
MTKLLIAAATALGIALAGMAPAMAQSSPTASYQVAQAAKKDEAPVKGKKKAKKKSAEKKAEGGEKKAAKKAKGKKKDATKT